MADVRMSLNVPIDVETEIQLKMSGSCSPHVPSSQNHLSGLDSQQTTALPKIEHLII